MNRYGEMAAAPPLHRTEIETPRTNGIDPRLPRLVSSQVLFRGEREIGIEHAGSLYRLKITRQGKLILNK